MTPPIVACPHCGTQSVGSSPYCHACGGSMDVAARSIPAPPVPPVATDKKPREPRVLPYRLLASVIDHLVVFVLVIWPLWDAFGGDTGWIPTVWTAVGLVYLAIATLWTHFTGLTVGKRLLGFRTVFDREESAARVVRRVALLEVMNLVLFLGAWSVLFNKQRRGWYERASFVRHEPDESLALEVLERIKNARSAPAQSVPGPSVELLPEMRSSGVDIEDQTQVRATQEVVPPPAPIQVSPPTIVAPTPPPPPHAPIVPPPVVEVPTVVVPPAPAPAAPTVVVPPTPAPAESTRVVEPRTPAKPVTEWTLEFDEGLHLPIDGSGLIGRDPEPRPGETIGQLVRLADDSWSLSKTHLEFSVRDGVWVRDRGSTNGSTVEIHGVFTTIEPWKGVLIPEGGTVHMGARQFRVVRTRGDA
ncbi:RDD family protein [Smaragdicoccus niigatensis]|uniref:RDD family protein n=1 Tax=Smaragdicoccus niigatensis TaxID=359359 RepID=UPI0003A03CDF|nr:RDD family protein [Smaragdicoccus niigatensis]